MENNETLNALAAELTATLTTEEYESLCTTMTRETDDGNCTAEEYAAHARHVAAHIVAWRPDANR